MGKQIISFKATFEDGTVVTTQAEIETNDASAFRVGAAPCYIPPVTNPSVSSKANITADISFAGYPSGSPAVFGVGEVGYYYATSKPCNNNSQSLTKPVIFIDGFDALDKREIPEIYTRNLAFEQNGAPKNLGEDLRDKGYDLIVLNFPVYNWGSTVIDGGSDYIERNAMVLVKLIQQVNASLPAGSTEKLVIVGPSMGGLISKYALAYMEKQTLTSSLAKWNHNTRLWISFDAPHHGANIPIGAQQFLKYYANVNNNAGARASLENKINATATKQMVLHHHLSGSTTGSFGTGFWPFRGTYRTSADANGLPGSNGFPMNVRKLAIASGSQSGVTTGNPGDLVLRLKAEKYAWLVFWYDWQTFSTADIRMSGGYGNTTTTFDAWTLSRSGGFSANASESWLQSLDTSPGGLYNTMEELGNQARSSTNNWFIWDRVRVDVYNPVNCFIPTKSALSFSSGGMYGDSAENLTNRSLVCTGETPFDAYYAPLQNEGHISLNAGNVAWIMPELDGIKNVNAPPVPVITPTSIVADPNNTTCINTAKVYYGAQWSSNDIISATWIATGDWAIQGPNNLYYVVVMPTGTGTGTIRRKVVMKNICIGTYVGTTSIQITAVPNYAVGITKNFTNTLLCRSKFPLSYSASLTPAQLATIGGNITYNWTSTGGLVIDPNTATSSTVSVKHMSSGKLNLEVSSDGLCIGKGIKKLPIHVGPPVMISENELYLVSCNWGETVFVKFEEGVTSITIDGVTTPTTTGIVALPPSDPSMVFPLVYTVSATNACGRSIDYPVTVTWSTIMGCKTVAQAPKTPEITISPNPASTYIDVANILAGSEVKIYTKMGVLVHSQQSENDKIRLDISKLTTDLYILEAVLPNNVRIRKQIVKQ